MVCGARLRYNERAITVVCNYCGRQDTGHIVCPQGHYICDHCHNQDALRIIEDMALATESPDPFAISELAMSFPGLPMLGCQHAFIAGGALMAALKNNRVRMAIGADDIQEVFHRIQKQAHGGYCGLTGVCGVTPAIGACLAVLTGSRCSTDKEQRITMEIAVQVARAIAELTGPSCCKAYVRTALREAVLFLRERLDIRLPPAPKAICSFSARHPHGCRKSLCPFFEGEKGS